MSVPTCEGRLLPCRSKNRPAIIDPKGVAQLLRAIDGYQGSPVVLAALRLAPLVFVRPGELRQAEWSEIDLDAEDGPRWSIPRREDEMRPRSYRAAVHTGRGDRHGPFFPDRR